MANPGSGRFGQRVARGLGNSCSIRILFPMLGFTQFKRRCEGNYKRPVGGGLQAFLGTMGILQVGVASGTAGDRAGPVGRNVVRRQEGRAALERLGSQGHWGGCKVRRRAERVSFRPWKRSGVAGSWRSRSARPDRCAPWCQVVGDHLHRQPGLAPYVLDLGVAPMVRPPVPGLPPPVGGA